MNTPISVASNQQAIGHSAAAFSVAALMLIVARLCGAPDAPADGSCESPRYENVTENAPDKLAAWNTTLRGAVYAGYYVEGVEADLKAAKEYGIRCVRLFFPAEQNASGNDDAAMTIEDLEDWDSKYFQSDRFERALKTLDATIAIAAKHDLKVIISPGLVPGSHGRGPVRWRLFRRHHWHDAFAQFWKQLATRYRDNPAVIGYLLLNEPGFESTSDVVGDDREKSKTYYDSIRETPADLNLLYRKAIKAIRQVDEMTPVIVQPGLWGRPHALEFLKPIDDERVIYCVHWYGPWLYTTLRHNRGRWTYPGPAPSNFAGDADSPGELMDWNIDTLRSRMDDPIKQWQARHNIPSCRIYFGEFGVDRRIPGADRWLKDVVSIIEENGWHWTYYMFREREWNGMDHELIGENEGRSANTPTFRVLVDALRGGQP